MKSDLQPQVVARLIDIPVDKWPGNCHAIAIAMVKRGVVKGKAIYGHYHGYIDADSIFGPRPFTHHGWVVTPDKIIDPTRWVFEGIDPYIYEGPKDDDAYDPGGNRVRKMFMRPAPPFVRTQNVYEIPPHIAPLVQTLLDYYDTTICAQQAGWIASLPLDMLGEQVEEVYRWIIDDVKTPGFIPVDNRNAILGENA